MLNVKGIFVTMSLATKLMAQRLLGAPSGEYHVRSNLNIIGCFVENEAKHPSGIKINKLLNV